MEVTYAGQASPKTITKSIFLVGPTPRKETGGESWREGMLQALEKAGYDGVVYIPEPEDGKWPKDYSKQITWEQKYIEQCDVVLAWVPRELKTMPAFTTNVEFGETLASGKLIYGRPNGAPKTRYLDSRYEEKWGREALTSLTQMAEAAVAKIGEGALRIEGERSVPLDIWKTKQFQAWYTRLREAGNRLDDAKLLWPFYVGPKKDFLFCFTLWVKVWVEDEQRHKSNEFIFSRTDISTIVAYARSPLSVWETKLVIVKEFRSPARTKDGYVHELPGGSSTKTSEDPLTVAAHELEEETSLKVEPARFKMLESRQVAATLSTHHAVVFAAELTAEEMTKAELIAVSGKHFGIEADSEQTYVEIYTLTKALENGALDWATLGMIWRALSDF